MREKTIEAKLVKNVRSMGGLALKFSSPGFDGVPDRLVLLPGGRIAFIELEALGFSVYCIDGVEQIGGILSEIQSS